MGMGRPKVALILTDDERQRLDSTRWHNVRHRRRRRRWRAWRESSWRALRAPTATWSLDAYGSRRDTVCKWRGRFITSDRY